MSSLFLAGLFFSPPFPQKKKKNKSVTSDLSSKRCLSCFGGSNRDVLLPSLRAK